MIQTIKIIESRHFSPYHNLAVEESLLHACAGNECILYLWQNQRTVVIGRNQNAWKECRTSRLEEDGGHLARRLSGGGAVYHDLGNLNFTFLVREPDYDVEKQTEVILQAVRRLGIPAVRSGRNDLLADGRKFSGNAYYKTGDRCYHHGTLMVDVDKEILGKYLAVSKEKLQAKGVESVRSRVANLKELCPELTIEELKYALGEAFREVYGLPSVQITEEELDQEVIKKGEDHFSSWDWIYGRKMEFQIELSHRFQWGDMTLQLRVDQGRVTDAAAWSDALDTGLTAALPAYLKQARCTRQSLTEKLALFSPADPAEIKMMEDILDWIRGVSI